MLKGFMSATDRSSKRTDSNPEWRSVQASSGPDLSAVRTDIARALHDRSHDDGSLGPLLIRFAWHASGTYDATTMTGGSNGGTIWLRSEAGDPENAGFEKARVVLKRLHQKHSATLSLADLSVLAGCVAIEESGGPHIPFAVGRVTYTQDEAIAKNGGNGSHFGDGKINPHGSRLPAADLGPVAGKQSITDREKPTIDAVRNTFRRMGFDDRETVCLIVLGHQYGRCHPEVSGYENPWYSFDPAHWNVYEHGLGFLSAFSMGRYREVKTAAGKRQWEMILGGLEPFMMLPSDMVLTWDPDFRQHLDFYEMHRRHFKRDAAAVFQKLVELGCEGLTPERGAAAMN